MGVDGAGTDKKFVGNLLVGKTIGKQREYFGFALRKAIG